MNIRYVHSILALLIAAQLGLYAQPGTLDTTFGNDGIVLLPVTPGNDFLSHAAMQSTGHMLLLSGSKIYRVDEEGEMDLVFGTEGVLDVVGFVAERIHVVENDAIIVVGAGNGNFHVRRYDADGMVDPAFGVNGTVSVDFGLPELVRGSYLASTGHILVLGRNTVSENNDAVIARFTAEGALDTSFGTDGAVIIDIAGSNDEAWTADETADGDYIVGIQGYVSGNRYYMVKLSTTGVMDMGFGTDGMPWHYVSNRPSFLRRVAVDPLGRIVGAGFYDNVQNYNWATIRRSANGFLDSFFGDIGVRTEPTTLRVDDLLMLEDGTFIVVGYGPGQMHDFMMIRYTTEGLPHPAFGDEGYVRTDGGNGQHDRAMTILRLPDGKLMLAGHSQVGSNWQLMLARYSGVDISTGIDAAQAEQTLELFPNPVRDRLFVRAAEPVTHAELFDATGRRVGAWSPMAERFELPMEGMTGGVYFVRLYSVAAGMVVAKVVRE